MKTILRFLLLCLLASPAYGQIATQNLPPAQSPAGGNDLILDDQTASYPTCTTAGAGGANNCTRIATLSQIQAFILGTGALWQGNTISVNHGGTGAISLTGLLKGNGTSPIGSALATDVLSLFGSCSVTQFVRGDGTCAAVSLTTNITGILQPPAGGTGVNNGINTITITGNPASFASPADGLMAPIDLVPGSGCNPCVASDNGRAMINNSASPVTWTIPANSSVPYPIGASLTFIVRAGMGVATIQITTDVLYWAGTTSTAGTRTLTAIGIATAVKTGTTEWTINGVNIT